MNALVEAIHGGPVGELKFADLEKITDIWIPEKSRDGTVEEAVRSAFAYAGDSSSVRFTGEGATAWLGDMLEHVRKNHANHTDFRLEYDDKSFRAHRAQSYFGPYLALRRLPSKTPLLADLQLPTWWRELLMLPDLMKGGLIVIAAVTGQGKSTTIAAAVKSRLLKFGGHCVTLEDPVELMLHGHHGPGFCMQKNVDPELPYEQRFSMGIVDAMREFPALSRGGAILLVGEVRDSITAGELVRAANNGMLVLTTVHASNVRTALQRLYSLAAQTMGETVARQDLAGATRLVLHQKLEIRQDASLAAWQRGRLSGEVLFSPEDSSAAAVIRSGEFNKLNDTLEFQRTWLNRDEPKPTLTELLKALSGKNH